MDTSYLKLVADTRIRNFLGLVMDSGTELSRPKCAESDYAYIDIPIAEIHAGSGPAVEVKKGHAIQVRAACTVEVRGRGYRFEVHPNPIFWEYGACQGMYYLEPGSGRHRPSFHVVLRKDLDLAELPADCHAIRIYMRQ